MKEFSTRGDAMDQVTDSPTASSNEMESTMRMSEAMRLGTMLRPTQAFGSQFARENDATCAIGAVADALGILDYTVRNGYTGKAPKEWKGFVFRETACPSCGDIHGRVDEAVIHLNNEHRWTRGQIADWVEGLERAFYEPTQAADAAGLSVDASTDSPRA